MLSVTNDCAELNIGLIQGFINTSQIIKDHSQKILLVAQEKGKIMSNEMSEDDLSLLE